MEFGVCGILVIGGFTQRVSLCMVSHFEGTGQLKRFGQLRHMVS